MDQGSPEWFEARLGKITASRIGDVMAKGRSGAPSATRAKYLAQVLLERLTGDAALSFRSAAMQWGNEQEDAARAAYELRTGNDVITTGFAVHPEIQGAGASADALVNDDGLLEIKCPESHTHLDTLTGAPIDRRYVLQMQWQMDCEQRDWCDFASFNPRFPPGLQLHVRRVDRDEALIAEIREAVWTGLAEITKRQKELLALMEDAIPGLDDMGEGVQAVYPDGCRPGD